MLWSLHSQASDAETFLARSGRACKLGGHGTHTGFGPFWPSPRGVQNVWAARVSRHGSKKMYGPTVPKIGPETREIETREIAISGVSKKK
jgi:hypothetical protein